MDRNAGNPAAPNPDPPARDANALANTDGAAAHLPTVVWQVDRTHATMRGLWRLLAALVIGAILFIARIDWGLLWLTDKASFLGLGLVMLLVGSISLGFVIAGLRWIALACWPGPLQVLVSPGGIQITLGPFGSRRYDWTDVRVDLDQDFDCEMLELMPDDAFVPRLIVKATGEDIIRSALRYTPVSHEAIAASMRGYLMHAMKERE